MGVTDFSTVAESTLGIVATLLTAPGDNAGAILQGEGSEYLANPLLNSASRYNPDDPSGDLEEAEPNAPTEELASGDQTALNNFVIGTEETSLGRLLNPEIPSQPGEKEPTPLDALLELFQSLEGLPRQPDLDEAVEYLIQGMRETIQPAPSQEFGEVPPEGNPRASDGGSTAPIVDENQEEAAPTMEEFGALVPEASPTPAPVLAAVVVDALFVVGLQQQVQPRDRKSGMKKRPRVCL